MLSYSMLTGIAACLAIVIGLVQLIRLRNGPLSHLPGTTLSMFSDVRTKIAMAKGLRCEELLKLHRKYGPVVRIGPSEVSVADLDSTRTVHKSAGGFLKSDFYDRIRLNPGGNMFSTRDPAYHQQLRKLLGNSMSESNIKTLHESVKEKTDLLIAGLKEDYARDGHIDVVKWTYYFSTDVIAELSFGESFDMLRHKKENQYMTDLRTFAKYNAQRMAVMSRPLYEVPNVPVLHINTLYAIRDRMFSYAETSIARYRKNFAANMNDPAKKAMLFSRLMGEKGQAAGFTDREMVIQAQSFIVAGTDTTAVTLAYIIYLVSSNPAVRAKLEDAIADLPEDPTNEQLKAVTYLENIIDETLRLYSAAPGPLPRVVPNGGSTLAGHFIPEGKVVSPVAYVLHRDPSIFRDPEVWNPERWEAPTEDMKHAQYAFGGGSRVCIGMHLSRMEMRMATVAFFKAFPNATPAFGVDGFSEDDMQLREYFLCKPKGSRCLIK